MSLFPKKNSDNANSGKKFNVYSLINSFAIIILFIAVGLVILGFRGVFKFSSGFFLLLLTMFIVSGASLLALPWIRRLQNGKHKIISLVFLSLLILCAIFWLISSFLIVRNFSKITGDSANTVIAIINFIKFTLIYTMNYATASLIATNLIKYGKKMVAFQAILYTSNLIVDLYFTFLFCCIHFNSDSFVSFSEKQLKWLANPIITTIIIIAFVYMIIANVIAKKIERRRLRYAKSEDDMPDEVFGGETQPAVNSQTSQEKLAELKSMLEQNLITQEEYDKKKNEILNKM